MQKGEKLVYQNNKSAYEFVLGFLLLNMLATILTLNYMAVNINIGAFIMLNIVLSLTSFLMAMKVKKYSFGWACGAIAISLLQLIRCFFLPEIEDSRTKLSIIVIMIISALLILVSGINTIIKAKIRLNYLNHKA